MRRGHDRSRRGACGIAQHDKSCTPWRILRAPAATRRARWTMLRVSHRSPSRVAIRGALTPIAAVA